MTVIRDRRHEVPDDKFGTDKQRFIERYSGRVRKAIQDDVAKRTLGDISKDGIKIPIPKATTREPIFHHIGGNIRELIYPGNKLDVGDEILKPKGGGGGGGPGDGHGEGEGRDDYIWLNEAEYLEILFEGRSLPDMTKLKANKARIIDREHAGYSDLGPDHRLDMERTEKKRKDESMVLGKGAEKRILENLAEQFNILAQHSEKISPIKIEGKLKEERKNILLNAAGSVLGAESIADIQQLPPSRNAEAVITVLGDSIQTLNDKLRGKLAPEQESRLKVLEARLVEQFKGRSRIDRLREDHMVYEYDDDKPKPNAKAVMICLMDVSYSMDQERKNTAKVFFWLLSKFLKATYDEVDIVFVAHTERAFEVDEQDFFYGQETGGTVVSSCLEKALEIVEERYPVGEWNIYSAQASDGDNSYSDNMKVHQKMEELLPLLQAHYYIEIGRPSGYESPLFHTYEEISDNHNGKLYVAGGLQTTGDSLDAFKKFFPMGGSKPKPGPGPSPA